MPSYPDVCAGIAGGLETIADDDEPLDDDEATSDPNTGGTDNTLGTPQSYDDITYVIGGFGWKARWIDANGYIITGSAVQYNLETMEMSALGVTIDCGIRLRLIPTSGSIGRILEERRGS